MVGEHRPEHRHLSADDGVVDGLGVAFMLEPVLAPCHLAPPLLPHLHLERECPDVEAATLLFGRATIPCRHRLPPAVPQVAHHDDELLVRSLLSAELVCLNEPPAADDRA